MLFALACHIVASLHQKRIKPVSAFLVCADFLRDCTQRAGAVATSELNGVTVNRSQSLKATTASKSPIGVLGIWVILVIWQRGTLRKKYHFLDILHNLSCLVCFPCYFCSNRGDQQRLAVPPLLLNTCSGACLQTSILEGLKASFHLASGSARHAKKGQLDGQSGLHKPPEVHFSTSHTSGDIRPRFVVGNHTPNESLD